MTMSKARDADDVRGATMMKTSEDVMLLMSEDVMMIVLAKL
jgi:hypothetical protein